MTSPSSPLRDHGRALALAVLGLAIRITALGAPPVHDDHAQIAMLRGTFPAHRALWDLFAFVRPGEAAGFRLDGFLPWWTDAHFAIAMFRPLSSLALAAEFTLGGPRLAHAASALIFAALVVVAGDVFRATLPRPVAWIATLLLALSPAATLPLLWIANQNALLSVLLGLIALAALIRGRDILAHAALLLAALSGEYAVPMLGYLVVFALGRPRPAPRVATLCTATLLPLLLGRALHYGAEHSQYLDPLRAPSQWLAQAPDRALALVGTALLGQSSGADYHGSVLPFSPVATVFGAALLLAAFAVTLRRYDAAARVSARAWTLGAALALLPVLSAPALPRLLLPSAPGVAALLAVLCAAPIERFSRWRTPARPGLAAVALSLLLLVIHLALVPWQAHIDVRALAARFARTRDAVTAAAPLVNPEARCDVLLGALDLEALHYPHLIWRESGVRSSRCWRVLTSTFRPFALTRLDARTLLLRSEGGALVEPIALTAYRAGPVRVGEVLVTPTMTITVIDAFAGYPTALRIDLVDDIDAYAWWVILGGRMIRLPISRMSGVLRVPPPS